MSFPLFDPSVFVIGEEYEILVCSDRKGYFSLEVAGKTYYPQNSGVLPSGKNYAKMRLPQKELDSAKTYRVIFREDLGRKAYYAPIGAPETKDYAFRPIEKSEGIRLYHIADVHYAFEMGKRTATYFGDEVDMYVINGDIGEVETVENFVEVCRFVGEISHGAVPVLFVRGNHDTRGALAELYPEYFPCNSSKTYFTFSVGPLCGVALDCGEDKPDHNKEYGGDPELDWIGTNAFMPFRREETAFLRGVTLPEDKIPFAVSHICPIQAIEKPGSVFDIERDVYTDWNKELERMGIHFMLCGHVHRAYLLKPQDSASLIPQNYPVVVGSTTFRGATDLVGAAVTVYRNRTEVAFTNAAHEVVNSFVLE